MAGERERAEAARGDQVARREPERPVQRLLRLRVVGRIAGLARPLLVGEAEQRRATWTSFGLARSDAWSLLDGAAVLLPTGREARLERSGRRRRRRSAARSLPTELSRKMPPRSSDDRRCGWRSLAPGISLIRLTASPFGRKREGRPAGRPSRFVASVATAPRSPGAGLPRTGTCSRTARRCRPRRRRAGCSASCWEPERAVQERAVALGDRPQLDVDDVVAEPAAVREPAEVGVEHRESVRSAPRRPCRRARSVDARLERRVQAQQVGLRRARCSSARERPSGGSAKVGAARRPAPACRGAAVEQVLEVRDLGRLVAVARTPSHPRARSGSTSPSGRAGSGLR